ncbi:MAG: metallophosphoesterase, partial [Planctomycetaceae bacterium]|nr:metallophosphoesterase [Planctomycetaceae bacterium]
MSGVKPYLQNPAPDAMTVIWFTEANTAGSLTVNLPGGGTLQYTSTPEFRSELAYHPNEAATGRSNAPWMHRIRVTELTPETNYNYTVIQGIETFTGELRTSPVETSSVRFIVYGDSETEPESTGSNVLWTQPGNPGSTRRYVADQTVGYSENLKVIELRNPDFIGIAGDIVESGGEQRDWDEFWRHNAGDINDIASSIPIFAAPGNHEDYGGPGAFGGYTDVGSIRAQGKFQTYWETPSNGTAAYDDRYYRVDYGPITYISLDVTNGQPNGTGSDTNWLLGDGPGYPDFNPGSVQYQWLETQLADAQANSRFTFVQLHHVPYSTGPHGFPAGTGSGFDNQSGVPVRTLTPLFAQYGVDAVLSGHDEAYQHSLVNGIHFFDIGIGGDGLRGPSSGPDSANPSIITNPFQVFTAHLNAPEVWNGSQLVSGGKHYGHMEINVSFDAASGTWKAQLDPVYVFPLMDTSGNITGWERRIYNDTTILTANAAPTGIALNSSIVAENQPIGKTIGLLSSVDASDDIQSYTLVPGPGSDDNASFMIVGNILRTNSSFDFETKDSYTIRVRTTDQGNLSFEQSLTISVSDVAEGVAASLVGIDFGGGAVPGNWNSYSGTSNSTLNNLIDETGTATGISAAITRDSSPGGAVPFTPQASTLPQHSQSLAGLDGIYEDQFGNIELNWGNLTPGATYEIYVFGGNEIPGNPRVTITGASVITFGQAHAASQLVVNDQVGDSTQTLSAYAKLMNADASGHILVRVDSGNGVSFFGTAGMAIRPVALPPGVTVSLSSGAGSISEAGGSTTLTATLSAPAEEDVYVYLQSSGSAVSNTDFRITSETAPITIDGDFSDWNNNPSILFGADPFNDTHDTDTNGAENTPLYVNHPDVDLREFGVTHDDENLYFYFRSEGQIGRTQVADPTQGKAAGRFYVIVTMDVDHQDATGYQLHEGGYYPTTPGYDMNSEIEFYNGTFNTGNYLNHGATDQASLNQAFAEQSNDGYDPAQAALDIQGPFNPGFLRVIPGSYDFYTQWVYKENDPANGGNDSVTFVKDKGPIVTGIIQQQISADGHELEMIVPYKGFLVDQNGDPIVDVGKILDLSFSLEASGELAPGNEWASDTADPLNGYALTATSELPVNFIRIPKGQTTATVQMAALDNSVFSPNQSAVIEIGSVIGAAENGSQQVIVAIADDESQSLIVSSTAVSVTEGSGTAFGVSLSTQPGSDVTVTVTRTSGDSDLSVSIGATLVFNSTNWNTPQIVTLAAAVDADGANDSAIFSVAADGVATVDVTATEMDNAPTFEFSGGVLTVSGTPLDDTITVFDDAGIIKINASGSVIDTGLLIATVTAVTISGLGGDDTLQLDSSLGTNRPGTLLGGPGNDILIGGLSSDILMGEQGIDTLEGGAGTDALDGGPGNDTYVF